LWAGRWEVALADLTDDSWVVPMAGELGDEWAAPSAASSAAAMADQWDSMAC